MIDSRAKRQDELDRAMAEKYGRNLRRARDQAGLTQSQLAERADVHRTSVGLLELGQRSAKYETTVRLAGALGIPPGSLLRGITWKPNPGSGKGTFVIEADDA